MQYVDLNDFKYDVSGSDLILKSYIGNKTEIKFPDYFEIDNKQYLSYKINEFCFCYSDIINVELPKYLTVVENSAFLDCIYLEYVKFNEFLTVIKTDAFRGCEKLNNVDLPNSLIKIDDNAFSGCFNLENLNIPNSVNILGTSPFNGTKWYKKKSETSSLIIINNMLSDAKNSKCDVYVPDKIEYIAPYSFYDLKINNIYLPKSVKIIEEGAFNQCPNLNYLILPENLEKIGDVCFSFSGIKYLTIPENIKSLATNFVDNCDDLEFIVCSQNIKNMIEFSLKLKNIKTYNYNEYTGIVYDDLINERYDIRKINQILGYLEDTKFQNIFELEELKKYSFDELRQHRYNNKIKDELIFNLVTGDVYGL